MSDSESLFEDYLKKHNFSYEPNFLVNPGDVDFKVEKNGVIVLCDVKEVRDWEKGTYAQILPQDQIRRDIKKLRGKFGKQKPSFPVVLVTMNFVTKFFTGLSIATALFGNIGIYFDPETILSSGITRLVDGNAALTRNHNTAISAVFGFNVTNLEQHSLFINPFASNPLPEDYFPVSWTFTFNEFRYNLNELSVIMFWPKS